MADFCCCSRRYADDLSDDSDYARMRRPQRGTSPEHDRGYRRPYQRKYREDESDSDEDAYRRPTRRKPPVGDRESELRNSRGGSVRSSGERASSNFTPKTLGSSHTNTSSAAWQGDVRKDSWVEKENSRPAPAQSWTSATRSHDRDRSDERSRRGSHGSRDYDMDAGGGTRGRDGAYPTNRSDYSDDESPYADSLSPDMPMPNTRHGSTDRESRSRSKSKEMVEHHEGGRGSFKDDALPRREDGVARGDEERRGSRGSRDDNSRARRDPRQEERRDSFGERSRGSDYREEVYKHALTTYGSQSGRADAGHDRDGVVASRTSSPYTADEVESQESAQGVDCMKDSASCSNTSSPRSGSAFIMYSPPSGGNTDLVQCLIVRERTGMGSSMYPSYKLFLEDKNKLLLIGRKMNFNSTSNYHIFDMTRGTASKKLTKKSGNYLGKLRAADSNR